VGMPAPLAELALMLVWVLVPVLGPEPLLALVPGFKVPLEPLVTLPRNCHLLQLIPQVMPRLGSVPLLVVPVKLRLGR